MTKPCNQGSWEESSHRSDAATAPLLCTLYVGGVVPWNLSNLQAGTSEDCSGGFQYQWTNGQFADDIGGWHRITGSIQGPIVYGAHNDTTFFYQCNSNPNWGQYDYRLEARGYAVASDGTQVSGYLEYGNSSKWTCQ